MEIIEAVSAAEGPLTEAGSMVVRGFFYLAGDENTLYMRIVDSLVGSIPNHIHALDMVNGVVTAIHEDVEVREANVMVIAAGNA